MARIYREHPDSSHLLTPRIFTRVFCQPGQLIETVRFYEQLTQERLDMDMDMDIPEAGLHVVAVGSFLIIELDPETHGLASQTTATVLNADLDQAVARHVAAGAEIVQERRQAPVGTGTRLRHPDGLIVDHLEHRPTTDDVPKPGPEFT
jgi:predicted enzyme related to lactoylglutathione lyase